MNILLWTLQAILALHTATGALWKLSNPAQTVPSLQAIPHGAWLSMSALELLFSLCLIAPLFLRPLSILAPIAALCIAAEMLVFSALHVYSGDPNYGPMVYWLVTAALCAFIAYGRLVLKPLHI